MAACALTLGWTSSADAAQVPTDGGKYYLYNALSGKFLSRGSSWGTRAIGDDYGCPLTLEAADAAYHLKFIDNELYLGDTYWLYTDCGTDRYAAYTISEVTGGYTLASDKLTANNLVYIYLKDDADKYAIAGNATSGDNISDEAQTVWQFLNQTEHDAIIAQKQLTDHIAIASAAGKTVETEEAFATLLSEGFEAIDATSTYLGTNVLNGNADGWTVNGVRKLDESWAAYVGGSNGTAESFSAATSLTKELTGLKAGIYKVSMNGFFRQGNNGVCWANKEAGFLPSNAYLQAGNYATALKAWGTAATFDSNETYTPDNTAQAVAAYTNGDYLNEVYTYVGEDGKLTISVNIPNFINWAGWACYNNVQLTYYRDTSADVVPVTAITLNQNSASLTIGDVLTLTPTITPDNADDPSVTWTSSDKTVATVTNGVVTALKVGTATITASANGGENVEATCAVTVVNADAPSFYSEITDGDFYIMNAATGKFLGGGNDWGTHASIINHGIPFTVAVSDGKYTLDSHTYNSDTDHFFNGTYIDQPSTNLYIYDLGDGKYSISTANGANYVTASAGNTKVESNADNANSELAQWYFLSKADRDKMLAAATAENPVDATYYIKEANPSRNLRVSRGQSGWTNIGYGQDKNQINENYTAEVYNASVNVYQTIENIPNGTYKVRMQGFTSGTDVKLYANSDEVDVLSNSESISAQSAAARRFLEGAFVNELTVTVTDRTMKIGLKGDCTGSKWLVYDNFELLMTNYIPVTGITATIDPEDGKIEIGKTAQITFATNPSPASFDAISITSSDDAIATVSETGLVTGVAEGTATITITANEMESFTKTFEVNVVTPAIIPSSVTLDKTEIALNATTTSETLTATVGAEGAPQAVVWTSSNENVATVAEGVVTAVLPGTAIIRATALNYDEVYAEATVNVEFPESTVPASYYENDGATRKVYTMGENLFKNGTFGYPNAVYGWKTVGYTTDAVASNFTISATGGVDDGAYITTDAGGVGSEKTIRKSIAVEVGKTYYFCVYTSGKAPSSDNFKYNALFKMSDATTETGTIKEFEWPEGANNTATDWSKTECIFTAETPYVGVRMGWNASSSFDNFVLAEVESTTEGNVEYATAAIPTANIGTGAFQYSQDAIDAANALVQGTATVEDVKNAYAAVTTLNVPEATQAYNLVFSCEGHSATGNALTLIPNPNQTQGLYGLKYLTPANVNLAQAFYFVHTTGNKYKVFAVDTDGKDRYITTQAEGYGTTWYEGIRTIDDASKAMEIEIRPNGAGLYLLWNTGANKPLAHNGNNNNDMFTNNTANFQFVETTKPSITINTTAAGWGTTILPFAASVPSGVKVYSCAETAGSTLTLVEVDALEANKPYIIEGSWEETLTGDAQGTALNYTEGLLTGTYEKIAAPNGSYILQKQGNKVGFFQVDTETAKPNVPANRAYLTDDNAGARAAYFLADNDATGISAIEGLTAGEATIYNVNGVQQQRLQKGMNIIVTRDGRSHKVMVK